tara:strand:- start:34 stop:333 length:300 start_codon:yes stop_codon:yes gene_type:complete
MSFDTIRVTAIKSLYSQAITFRGDDAFDNDDNKIVLDENLIASKEKELQTAYDNAKYQRDRAEAYPSVVDQLDMIYHAGQGGDNFQKAIKAVKDKYPKG